MGLKVYHYLQIGCGHVIIPERMLRLYEAVEECSNFAIALGINIPTGKDSLSMKQKYPEDEVLSPGTVIISAAAQCSDIKILLLQLQRLMVVISIILIFQKMIFTLEDLHLVKLKQNW